MPIRMFPLVAVVLAALLPVTSDAEETAPQSEEEPELILEEEIVRERRPLTAASERSVRQRDFLSFPRQNPSDLVRVIPGVHVSQHTGGAKAYQYFLRGFDAEHGQDLAAYLDGIPLNEPSQVHGHGYLDLHFLIPDAIGEIRIIKGPYEPEVGNFGTAGAIDFIPRRTAESHVVAAIAGMFGTARVLGMPHWGTGFYQAVAAAETDHTEGFTDPGWADAIRANQGHTFGVGPWSLNLASHHYAQRSAATDVIPEAWVRSGRVDRFGSLDPTDRVTSNLHLVAVTADLRRGPDNARLQVWYEYKRTTIWSNYTYFLLNPERGDQQEMRDDREVTGAAARYERDLTLGPTLLRLAGGVQWRLDLVDQILANTEERRRFNVINDLGFSENALGAWLRIEFTPARWVTLVPGFRGDAIFYRGRGTQDERFFNIYTNLPDTRQDVSREWNESAYALSPKCSVIFSPLRSWDLFLNYGEGFFSNTTLRMANEPRATIPKVRGGELGTRLFFWDRRITFAGALWFAHKEKDLVFDPQTGLSSTKGKTMRKGLDGELRVSPLSWLYLAADAAYVDARFEQNGDRIPNGPIFLSTQGIGWEHPRGPRGMVRGRYMGPRELDQQDWARPFYVVDLVAGYDADHWGIEAAVDNVLDSKWEDAVFSYETRPERGGETLNGIHWTPGTPFFARLSVNVSF